jgi:aspartokinase-like uncharacterized kinase
MIVVKIGGSLFDLPQLGEGLRNWLMPFTGETVVIVPGGGDLAEAVRKLDRLHSLGEEIAHQLAMMTLPLTAKFIQLLVPHSLIVPAPNERQVGVQILDSQAFFEQDYTLPHSWKVSSDSLAALVAVRVRATQLILLKSCDSFASENWTLAAESGEVDVYFPEAIRSWTGKIQWVNFRSWMERAGFASSTSQD